jgi:Ca-activated chloride channel homolog
MAKKVTRFPSIASAVVATFFAFAVGVAATGCTSRVSGRLGVLSGTLSWSRQDWASSASSFLVTASGAETAGDDTLRDYAVYGLASTYLSQDEYDPALMRLSSIRDSTDGSIRAAVWYQAGVIAYRRGEYDEAVRCFRESLRNDPDAEDAKVNLELSQRSLVERESSASASPAPFAEDKRGDDGSDSIFNLVRKKEEDRWKNVEGDASSPSVEDY